jgi:hypothetical protein
MPPCFSLFYPQAMHFKSIFHNSTPVAEADTMFTVQRRQG